MTQPKVSLISDDSNVTRQLQSKIHELDMLMGEVIDKPREAYLKIEAKEPRIIIFAEPETETDVVQIIDQLRKVQPRAPLLFLNRSDDYDLIRGLFRVGVTDVLHYETELDELDSIIKKANKWLEMYLHQAEVESAATMKETGKIMAFYGGKGGEGTTFISANVANHMAAVTSMSVLLIDLNLQNNDVQSMLNIKHNRNIGDLKGIINELTESQIKNVAYEMEKTNLEVLLSPNSPEDAENFTTDDIQMLLSACKRHYDLIVLDLPKELNEISISGLSNASQVFYTFCMERPSIERMQSVIDLFERYQLISENNLTLVINKHSKKQDITDSEMEKMSIPPIMGRITADHQRIGSAINLGIPLMDGEVKEKKGPAKDIANLSVAIQELIGGVEDVHIS